MAFKNTNFCMLQYANGFSLWHYKTEDALADTKQEGYFNEVSDYARTGDIILVSSTNDMGTNGTIYIISNVQKDNVTVTKMV